MLDNNLQNDPLFLRTARFASDRNADYVRKLNFQQDTVDATAAIMFLNRVSDHICKNAITTSSKNFGNSLAVISECRIVISHEYTDKWALPILTPVFEMMRNFEPPTDLEGE